MTLEVILSGVLKLSRRSKPFRTPVTGRFGFSAIEMAARPQALDLGKFAPWNNDSTLILAILWEGSIPALAAAAPVITAATRRRWKAPWTSIPEAPARSGPAAGIVFDNVAKNRRGPGARASGSSEPTGNWHTAGSGAGAPNFGAGVLPESCKELWPVAFSLSTRR